MFKKESPFLVRPEPPSVEHIVQDIQNADEDDVIFRILPDSFQDSGPQSPIDSFSSEEMSSPRRPVESGDDHNSANGNLDIDTVYQKALDFIQMNEELKAAPGRLKEQSDYLQEVGQQLRYSIDELKQEAQGVLDKSLSTKFDES